MTQKRTRRKAVNVVPGMILGVGPARKRVYHKIIQIITDETLKCQHFVIRNQNGKLSFIPHDFDQYVSVKTRTNSRLYNARKLRRSS